MPPTVIPGLMRYIAACIELWGHLREELDTSAKYESHRLELAQKVRKELKANDSAECRHCHTVAAMALASHPATASAAAISPPTMHQWLAMSCTCIDCHKGLAHALPQTD